MTELLLKILVIFVIGFILYLSFSTSRVKEGLTGLSGLSKNNTSSSTSTTSSSTSSSNGVAGNSTAYINQIGTQNTQLSDSLILTNKTYTQNYTEILNRLAVYTSYLQINTLLNISESEFNANDISTSLEKFNIYVTATANLENLIKTLPSQPPSASTSS